MATIDDRMKLCALQAIDRHEPATVEDVIEDVRTSAVAAGILSDSQASKIDRVYVGRDLIANWTRAEPPLVAQSGYRPDEVAPTGAVLGHAQSRFELTAAGEAEMNRLERIV